MQTSIQTSECDVGCKTSEKRNKFGAGERESRQRDGSGRYQNYQHTDEKLRIPSKCDGNEPDTG